VAYDNLTSRTDAAALIPEEVVNEVLTKATEQSAALTLFRRVPVSRAQARMPVLSALPVAYWVTGDTGQKQTSELAWANKYINIEEIAVILPVPNNVADDVDYDIWDEAKPLVSEAVGRTLDSAVFFGTNAPASFPDDVNTSAAAAGNNNTEGNTAAQGGFFGDFDETIALLEDDGYDYTGVVARTNAKGKFRAARNSQGDRLDSDRIGGNLRTSTATRSSTRCAGCGRPTPGSSSATGASSCSVSARTSPSRCSARASSRTTPAPSSSTSSSRT
jgi:hypothetical protein